MRVLRQGIQWRDFGTFECSPILSPHFSRASAPMTFTLTTYTHGAASHNFCNLRRNLH